MFKSTITIGAGAVVAALLVLPGTVTVAAASAAASTGRAATTAVTDPDAAVVEDVVAVPDALAPGRSWATRTPMPTVAPVAATTTPRVRVRSLDLALSLASGALG